MVLKPVLKDVLTPVLTPVYVYTIGVRENKLYFKHNANRLGISRSPSRDPKCKTKNENANAINQTFRFMMIYDNMRKNTRIHIE